MDDDGPEKIPGLHTAETNLHFRLKEAVMLTAQVAGLKAGAALENPTWNRGMTEIREVTALLRQANLLADMLK